VGFPTNPIHSIPLVLRCKHKKPDSKSPLIVQGKHQAQVAFKNLTLCIVNHTTLQLISIDHTWQCHFGQLGENITKNWSGILRALTLASLWIITLILVCILSYRKYSTNHWLLGFTLDHSPSYHGFLTWALPWTTRQATMVFWHDWAKLILTLFPATNPIAVPRKFQAWADFYHDPRPVNGGTLPLLGFCPITNRPWSWTIQSEFPIDGNSHFLYRRTPQLGASLLQG